MNVKSWLLMSVVWLCAALIIRWCAKLRARRQRVRNLVLAEEANQLCREYCEIIMRLQADPFNLKLNQRFLACAPLYHHGESSEEMTVEVERKIMHDLMVAGIRRSAMFGNPADS
jgi:hypothetical protein